MSTDRKLFRQMMVQVYKRITETIKKKNEEAVNTFTWKELKDICLHMH